MGFILLSSTLALEALVESQIRSSFKMGCVQFYEILYLNVINYSNVLIFPLETPESSWSRKQIGTSIHPHLVSIIINSSC